MPLARRAEMNGRSDVEFCIADNPDSGGRIPSRMWRWLRDSAAQASCRKPWAETKAKEEKTGEYGRFRSGRPLIPSKYSTPSGQHAARISRVAQELVDDSYAALVTQERGVPFFRHKIGAQTRMTLLHGVNCFSTEQV